MSTFWYSFESDQRFCFTPLTVAKRCLPFLVLFYLEEERPNCGIAGSCSVIMTIYPKICQQAMSWVLIHYLRAISINYPSVL